MATYSVLLLPDPHDGGFTVEVPCLPGVVTEGNTRQEALANAKDAIALMIEDLIADGEDVPTETVPPELAQVEIDNVSDSNSSTVRPLTRLDATA
jgi:predicted RNase H-like HicB family nuclease